MTRAVVLLSGGLDSSTTMAIARQRGFETYALSFDYGQRHQVEIDSARRVADQLGAAEHRIVHVDLRILGGSALTADIAVPKGRDFGDIRNEVPVTYVPARNTIFLAHALAWTEILDARDIFIGVNAVDYSGYPDCRPEFIAEFEKLAQLGTRAGSEGVEFKIHAPLISMSKAEIVRKGTELGVDFALTHSCYDPTHEGEACGECDSCRLRLDGFRAAGIADPIRYAQR